MRARSGTLRADTVRAFYTLRACCEWQDSWRAPKCITDGVLQCQNALQSVWRTTGNVWCLVSSDHFNEVAQEIENEIEAEEYVTLSEKLQVRKTWDNWYTTCL